MCMQGSLQNEDPIYQWCTKKYYIILRLQKECRLKAWPKTGFSSKRGYGREKGKRLGQQRQSCYIDKTQKPSERIDGKCSFQTSKSIRLSVNLPQIQTRGGLAALMQILQRCKFPPQKTALWSHFKISQRSIFWVKYFDFHRQFPDQTLISSLIRIFKRTIIWYLCNGFLKSLIHCTKVSSFQQTLALSNSNSKKYFV